MRPRELIDGAAGNRAPRPEVDHHPFDTGPAQTQTVGTQIGCEPLLALTAQIDDDRRMLAPRHAVPAELPS